MRINEEERKKKRRHCEEEIQGSSTGTVVERFDTF